MSADEELLSVLRSLHASGLPLRTAVSSAESGGDQGEAFLPPKLCRKLGSLLKKRIEAYAIPIHKLALHATALVSFLFSFPLSSSLSVFVST